MRSIGQAALPLPIPGAPGKEGPGLDVHRINVMARLESYNRHLYRPNAYLHKWWARRCGTVFRWILKTLVPHPERRPYETPGGLEGRVVLDPMMGGGTTLYEAIRMGASVVGMDVDPIPVLMVRAALSNVPLDSLRRIFEAMMAHLEDRLSDLWQTRCPECGVMLPLRFVLYGRRRICRCGLSILVDDMTLRWEGRQAVCRLMEDGSIVDSGRRRMPAAWIGGALRERGPAQCPRCGEPMRDETSRPFWARYEPIAVVGACPVHGLFFAPPGDFDRSRWEEAAARAAALDWGGWGDPEIRPGPKSADLLRAGVRSYLELFSPRQQLYLHHAIAFVRGIRDLRIRRILALLVSASLEFNSMLCGYKGHDARRPGAVRHVFAHHAYSIPYTALENNPLYPGRLSGTLRNLFARIERGRKWAARPSERIPGPGGIRILFPEGERAFGEEAESWEDLRKGSRRFLILQGSATDIPLPSDQVDFVVTDPPYFDHVQYHDLAAFFRVWLRRMLPEDADWSEGWTDRIVESTDPQRYADLLGQVFSECRRVLRKDGGRLVFTFHHWKPEAWAALTIALRRARFRLLQFYVIHSENPSSVHIVGQRALVHDAVLFMAPEEAGPFPDWELPERVDTTESEPFISLCAQSLGAMLAAEGPEASIWAQWRRLIRRPGEE